MSKLKKVYVFFVEDYLEQVFYNIENAVAYAIKWYGDDLREWYEEDKAEEEKKIAQGSVPVVQYSFEDYVEYQLLGGSDIYYVIERLVFDSGEEE